MVPATMLHATILVLMASAACVSCFGNSEDKFIKKYAMMKIYESCFGPEVVKQIRKEMKAACAKCAALESPAGLISIASPPPRPTLIHSLPPQLLQDPTKHLTASLESDGIYTSAAVQQQQQQQAAFDAEKLQQAILSIRPNPFNTVGYRPYHPASVSQTPYYQNGYQAAPGPAAYPGFYSYQPTPAAASPYAPSPYGFPLFAPQYMGNNRISRDMDIRSQLEALTSRMSGRVRNVTCVMQELGYLDENLEPNFQGISEKIATLPISDELRKDMQEGVAFCQQFSQCVPEIKRDKSPLSRELVRPMFFFKCYKHKKLEACIMKDVREKYAGVTDEDFTESDSVEFRRTGKVTKLSKDDDNIDDLATSMYDFLYGSDGSTDMDSIF